VAKYKYAPYTEGREQTIDKEEGCVGADCAPDRKPRSAWLISAMMSFGGAGMTSQIF
jgi:hypothetical protein